MKVENMKSSNGNTIPNQFIICTNSKKVFQSYRTTIAEFNSANKLTIDTNALEYSRTTSKYLYQFAGMNRYEILHGIKNGIIKVKKLNK